MRIKLKNLKAPRGIKNPDGDVVYFNNGDIVEVQNPDVYINSGIAEPVKEDNKKKK